MYERLLDKSIVPTEEDLFNYTGNVKSLFLSLDEFMTNELGFDKLIRFPYGKSYGWSFKYFKKSKHICDVFAEKDAFTVMMRLDDAKFFEVYDSLSAYSKAIIDHRYPCNDGGWIHYRVVDNVTIDDIKKIIQKNNKM